MDAPEPRRTDRHGSPGRPSGSTYTRHRPEETLLRQVVREKLETFLARAREREQPVPRFVERELRAYLACSVLSHDRASASRVDPCGFRASPATRPLAVQCRLRLQPEVVPVPGLLDPGARIPATGPPGGPPESQPMRPTGGDLCAQGLPANGRAHRLPAGCHAGVPNTLPSYRHFWQMLPKLYRSPDDRLSLDAANRWLEWYARQGLLLYLLRGFGRRVR